MERKAKKVWHGARYPDLKAFLATRGRAAGLGLLVSAVGLEGCFIAGYLQTPRGDTTDSVIGDVDGMIADTSEPATVVLPGEGSRLIEFSDPWGRVQYHLEVVVESEAVAERVLEAAAAVLQAADDRLLAHPVTDLAPGQDTTAIEEELATALCTVVGVSRSSLHSLVLVVDLYEDVGDIDGDPPA